LGEQDRLAFENRMQNNPAFKKEVELQAVLIDGIRQMSLQQSIQKAGKKYLRNKWFFKLGIVISLVILASSITYISLPVNKQAHYDSPAVADTSSVKPEIVTSISSLKTDSSSTPTLVSLPKTIEADEERTSSSSSFNPLKALPIQKYEVTAEKGALLETQEGILVSIPSHAFVDQNGAPVDGEVDIEIREALSAASIVKAGLSTWADDRLLETGGMFYIQATQNKVAVQINQDAEVLMEIPTDSIKEGMMLFDGELLADSSINWVNPKPLEQFLSPVDIHNLNFYPPKYEKTLSKEGCAIWDKAFKDSLYYTFYCGENDDVSIPFGQIVETAVDMEVVVEEERSFPFNAFREQERNKSTSRNRSWRRNTDSDFEGIDSLMVLADSSIAIDYACDGISSAEVKAFWNDEFQNTNLATQEFEERWPYLFRSCNQQALQTYLNHLDKPLYYSDSIVMGLKGFQFKTRFRRFFKRKDGRVKVDSEAAIRLQRYHKERSEIYAKAIAKTQQDFWRKQNEMDAEARRKIANRNNKNTQIRRRNWNDEFIINEKEAYRQLGKTPPGPNINPKKRYRARLTSFGSKNIDRYAFYTDDRGKRNFVFKSQIGQTGRVDYLDFSVQIEDANAYDRMNCYLVTDRLYSFIRLKEQKGRFNYQLNELLSYNLICLGYKGDQAFLHIATQVKSSRAKVELTHIDKSELESKINKVCKYEITNDLMEDLNLDEFLAIDKNRQRTNERIKALRRKLREVIFPCTDYGE
jgi:hypothetical protein